MTWWCSASSAPWSFAWRAYPGVWLFILLIGFGYWRWGRGPNKGSLIAFASGLLLLWLALDWPLGPLGGYLASAHATQFILLSLAAPPLLLIGLRPRLTRLVEASPRASSWLRRLAHPVVGLVGFNVPLFLTHAPGVVDRLMETQGGSFLIDLIWIISGLSLWWPVAAPERVIRLSPLLQLGYLFIQTIPSTIPAAFLVFSNFPLFKLYELAPRVHPLLTPANDHQVAGLMMKTVGDPVVWIGMIVVFFKWANRERREDLARESNRADVPSRA